MQSVVKPLTDFREHDIKGVNVCARLAVSIVQLLECLL